MKSRRAACYNEIDAIQQDLRKASVRENTAKMNVEQTQVRQLEAKQRCDAYRTEQESLARELEKIAENEDSIQMELETSENLEQELNEKIEALQSQLEKEREQESVQLKNSEDLHLSLAALEQQNTFIMENISRIDEETERFEAGIKRAGCEPGERVGGDPGKRREDHGTQENDRGFQGTLRRDQRRDTGADKEEGRTEPEAQGFPADAGGTLESISRLWTRSVSV